MRFRKTTEFLRLSLTESNWSDHIRYFTPFHHSGVKNSVKSKAQELCDQVDHVQ